MGVSLCFIYDEPDRGAGGARPRPRVTRFVVYVTRLTCWQVSPELCSTNLSEHMAPEDLQYILLHLAKLPIESLGLGALLGALIAEHSGDQRDLRGASSGWCGETLGVSAPFLDAPVA